MFRMSAGSFRFEVGWACTCRELAGHELAIAESPSVRRDHRAVLGSEVSVGDSRVAGRLRRSGFRAPVRPHADRRAAVLHRMAAGGKAFIGGASGIGRHQCQ